MKKSVLFTLLLLFLSSAWAQDSTKVKRNGPFLSIEMGVIFNPSYSFRSLTYQGNWGAENYPNISTIQSGDVGIFAPNVGLRISLILHQNMGVEFGLGYSKKGYVYDAIRSGYASSRLYDRYDFLYRMQYVEAPLKFIVRTGGSRVRFRAGIGLVTQVLVQADKIRTVDPAVGETYVRVEPLTKNPINLAPTVSAGIDVSVTDKFGLRVEPNFQHQLFRNSGDPLEIRYWSAGVSLTAYFNRVSK
ncbi:MAG: outer membrane beta-barrel protein [Flavobacteriales bacterium]|nr:outer membrane beta-barrel protein [Flavobacteriales bacterium]